VIGILLETPNSAASKKKPVTTALDSTSESPTRRLLFPRSSKLLKHGDFQRVYKAGRRHFSGLLTAFYLPKSESGAGPRIGITVGRVLGGAVDRNRIKRRLREAARLHLAELPVPVDVVINPKKNVLKAEFVDVEQEVARAFQVIRKYMDSSANNPKTAGNS
jgi:ribonuclease P protein component